MAIKPLQSITLKNEGGEDITYTLSGEYPDLTAGSAEQIISDEYTENKVPYLLRASNFGSKREDDTIVGGTVVWNQIQKNAASRTNNGITYTFSNGKLSVSGTATAASYWLANNASYKIDWQKDHVYLVNVGNNSYVGDVSVARWYIFFSSNSNILSPTVIFKPSADYSSPLQYSVANGQTVSADFYPQIFDLTQMFGSTIADYIYSLETATTGAGVAWFKSLFPADYYAYNAGELKSVEGVSAHLMKDADDNVVGNYPLDSSLTLRGIPKLDANNSLYYDGDTYESDGTVTRKYGIVDLGTLTWAKGTRGYFHAPLSPVCKGVASSYKANAVCPKYSLSTFSVIYNDYASNDKIYAVSNGNTSSYVPDVYILDSAYSDAAAFKTAMSGVYLVYELATPTTETADPYTNPQNLDPDGTEEYVSTSIVPVGHETKYFADLVERLAAIPEPPTANGTYRLIATVTGGVATLSWVAN